VTLSSVSEFPAAKIGDQGAYGKMTQIAQDYHISRTWLYQLLGAANLPLETLFSDQKPYAENPPPLLDPFILL